MSIEKPGSDRERVYGIGPHGQESAIKSTTTFEKLYEVLDEIGPVQGSQELFTPEKLKDTIERVRSGEFGLNYVTSTYGLRDRVERIMQYEKDFSDAEPAKQEGAPQAPEAISQEAQEKAFIEFLKETQDAYDAAEPFLDRKLIETGQVTRAQQEALVASLGALTQAGYEKFSSISQERQEEIQMDYEDERYGRKPAPAAETAPAQPSEPVAAPEEAQRLKEVQERLGIPEASENVTENPRLTRYEEIEKRLRELGRNKFGLSESVIADMEREAEELRKEESRLFENLEGVESEMLAEREDMLRRLNATMVSDDYYPTSVLSMRQQIELEGKLKDLERKILGG